MLTLRDSDVIIPPARGAVWRTCELVQRQAGPLAALQPRRGATGGRVAEGDLAIDHLFPQVSEGAITGPVVGMEIKLLQIR